MDTALMDDCVDTHIIVTQMISHLQCRKSVNRAGPGFGYGFIVAFCFCLSFFLLLAGLVMDSFRGQVKTLSTYDWTLNGTNTGDGSRMASYYLITLPLG